MKALFNNIDKYLPLNITFIEVEDYYISFGSKNWNFYSDSNWRIIKEGKIILSSDTSNIDSVKSFLLDKKISSIKPLSKNCLEPVFYLDNSIEFQVFQKLMMNLGSYLYLILFLYHMNNRP